MCDHESILQPGQRVWVLQPDDPSTTIGFGIVTGFNENGTNIRISANKNITIMSGIFTKLEDAEAALEQYRYIKNAKRILLQTESLPDLIRFAYHYSDKLSRSDPENLRNEFFRIAKSLGVTDLCD